MSHGIVDLGFIGLLGFAILAATPAASSGRTPPPHDAAAVEFFEKKVRPVLVGNCLHLPLGQHQLQGRACGSTTATACSRGATAGPPSSPASPRRACSSRPSATKRTLPQMPPKKQLSAGTDRRPDPWIQDGRSLAGGGTVHGRRRRQAEREVRGAPQVPLGLAAPGPGTRPPPCTTSPGRPATSTGSSWRGWSEEGLRPVRDADRSALIRRVTFDLTGLPPTPEEVDAFLADRSPDAYARLVDRLLASPSLRRAVGPPLARRGAVRRVDRSVPQPAAPPCLALPRLCRSTRSITTSRIDQFIREQIAGDLLPAGFGAGARRAPGRDRVPGDRREGRQPAVQGAVHHGQR